MVEEKLVDQKEASLALDFFGFDIHPCAEHKPGIRSNFNRCKKA
jgi:hypothetical protein